MPSQNCRQDNLRTQGLNVWIIVSSKLTDESLLCRIGFNSVYHITDIPSSVTQNHLVIFDPHTDILGVSAHNPGLKADFVKSQLRQDLPDQCAPYEVFGCNMLQPFEGTVFRLPLRTAAMATKSRLSKQASSLPPSSHCVKASSIVLPHKHPGAFMATVCCRAGVLRGGHIALAQCTGRRGRQDFTFSQERRLSRGLQVASKCKPATSDLQLQCPAHDTLPSFIS